MADPELPRYVARTDAELGKLDDPDADVVGERSAVDKNAAELGPILQNLFRRNLH